LAAPAQPPGGGGTGGEGGFAGGGGIFVTGSGLNLYNTTLGANTASGGSAGAGGAGGTVGTVHGAAGSVGVAGAAQGGGLSDLSSATLFNDTIAFNSVTSGLIGTPGIEQTFGGGIQSATSTAAAPLLINVMLETNTVNGVGQDIGGSISFSSTNDFISNTNGLLNGRFPRSSRIIENISDPQLAPLTFTNSGLGYYPLGAGSKGIDSGTSNTLAAIAAAEGVPISQATDEIGDPRLQNSHVDIGAVEYRTNPAFGHNHRPPGI
jgi:hypothetical protein